MKHAAAPEESHPADAVTEANTAPKAGDSDGIPENLLRVLDDTPRDEVNRAQPRALPGAEGLEAPAASFGNLGLACVMDIRENDLDVQIGSQIFRAKRHPTLHLSVLKTAQLSGEPVLVDRDSAGAITVMGALRTRPTPGVDAVENLTIDANRIHLNAKEEVRISAAGVATIALRAVGEIETYADRIVSRAEELHKIVGRMLRLN